MSSKPPRWQDATSGLDLLTSHIQSVSELLGRLDLASIERAGEMLDEAVQRGSAIYTVGNGGSAATALHIAADLSWGRRMGDHKRPKAISLVANSPIMTALSNDVSFDDVFVEQMFAPFQKSDVLVAISASGNSENVLRATEFANSNGGSSIGMTGFGGGKLKPASQVCVHVGTPEGAYEVVEDVHHTVCHMLANYLKYKAANR